MDTFGSRVRGLREARGWSQEKLGFELEVTGATVSKWETGRAEPNLRHLELFLQVFAPDNLSLDWLVAGAPSGHRPDKPRKPIAPSPRAADTQDEQALLARYRRLSTKKRKMLLGLLEDQ